MTTLPLMIETQTRAQIKNAVSEVLAGLDPVTIALLKSSRSYEVTMGYMVEMWLAGERPSVLVALAATNTSSAVQQYAKEKDIIKPSEADLEIFFDAIKP